MTIIKREEIGSIEVLSMGQIQVRTDTIIEEDGVEISKSYGHVSTKHTIYMCI